MATNDVEDEQQPKQLLSTRTTITVTINVGAWDKVSQLVADTRGYRKGWQGVVVDEALLFWIENQQKPNPRKLDSSKILL